MFSNYNLYLVKQEVAMTNWEYLVIRLGIDDDTLASSIRVVGKTKPKGLFSSEELDPLAEQYNRGIENLQKESGQEVSLVEVLNLLGNDGWEIASAANARSDYGSGRPFLFLKRPKSESK